MKKATVISSKPVIKKVAPLVTVKPIETKIPAPSVVEKPVKVVTPKVPDEIKPVKTIEPVNAIPTVADLKASLNDIPANLRTPELWKSRMEAHISTYGYESVVALADSRYFNKWLKG